MSGSQTHTRTHTHTCPPSCAPSLAPPATAADGVDLTFQSDLIVLTLVSGPSTFDVTTLTCERCLAASRRTFGSVTSPKNKMRKTNIDRIAVRPAVALIKTRIPPDHGARDLGALLMRDSALSPHNMRKPKNDRIAVRAATGLILQSFNPAHGARDLTAPPSSATHVAPAIT